MTIQDTRPKCGEAARLQTAFFTDYECGTRTYPKSEYSVAPGRGQSELCELRCELAAAKKELAAIKSRHANLVEAARKVSGQAVKITGGMGEFVGWEIDADDMTDLKKALESEANNG